MVHRGRHPSQRRSRGPKILKNGDHQLMCTTSHKMLTRLGHIWRVNNLPSSPTGSNAGGVNLAGTIRFVIAACLEDNDFNPIGVEDKSAFLAANLSPALSNRFRRMAKEVNLSNARLLEKMILHIDTSC
jgi:hypothetical protein